MSSIDQGAEREQQSERAARGDGSVNDSRTETELLRPVTAEVRQKAKALVRTARHAAFALAVPDGKPDIARIGLATDVDGQPVFPVSALSGRTTAMAADGRAAMLLGDPGKGDPLAHPRISLAGRLRQLLGEDHARVRRRYLGRHPKAAIYIDFADFSLWKLEVESASYIGGFGRAYELSAEDLVVTFDDWAAWHAMEAGAVEHMNEDHRDATELYATRLCGAPSGTWRITGVDPEGVDMACGDDHRRYTYDQPLTSTAELRPRLVELVKKARLS